MHEPFREKISQFKEETFAQLNNMRNGQRRHWIRQEFPEIIDEIKENIIYLNEETRKLLRFLDENR